MASNPSAYPKARLPGILRAAQLNLQNSAKVTTEARKLLDDLDLDFFLIQEPYSVGGAVRGFGLASSNKVIGNQRPDLRPMAAIVTKVETEPLELLELKTTHFTVIKSIRSPE